MYCQKRKVFFIFIFHTKYHFQESIDPLDCCEMTNFIDPSWRSECDFHLSFKGQNRLVVSYHAPVTEATTTTTTTERTNPVEDLMMVPHSVSVFGKIYAHNTHTRTRIKTHTHNTHSNSLHEWQKVAPWSVVTANY